MLLTFSSLKEIPLQRVEKSQPEGTAFLHRHASPLRVKVLQSHNFFLIFLNFSTWPSRTHRATFKNSPLLDHILRAQLFAGLHSSKALRRLVPHGKVFSTQANFANRSPVVPSVDRFGLHSAGCSPIAPSMDMSGLFNEIFEHDLMGTTLKNTPKGFSAYLSANLFSASGDASHRNEYDRLQDHQESSRHIPDASMVKLPCELTSPSPRLRCSDGDAHDPIVITPAAFHQRNALS